MQMLKFFRPRIRSRHPSHAPLRKRGIFPLFPFKAVIRFGSTHQYSDDKTQGGDREEINTVQAIKNSSSKLKMKNCFTDKEVKTADWYKHIFVNNVHRFQNQTGEEIVHTLDNLPYPIISKSHFGSRNRGNRKHDNRASLEAWLEGKDTTNYIFEKYYNYSREYRLHISKNGCFYACRKMLKRDTEDKDKWYRNDKHCVWILEENDLFDKPSNWDKIIKEAVKALETVGLDIGAVDLRIQSATHKCGKIRKDPNFIIVEINSAPSFGEITINKYRKELTLLLTDKK